MDLANIVAEAAGIRKAEAVKRLERKGGVAKEENEREKSQWGTKEAIKKAAEGPEKRSRTLYYGDNLTVLREHIKPESVDLVYLDPPFNSARNYNAFFHEEGSAKVAASQIQAFEDTWH